MVLALCLLFLPIVVNQSLTPSEVFAPLISRSRPAEVLALGFSFRNQTIVVCASQLAEFFGGVVRLDYGTCP